MHLPASVNTSLTGATPFGFGDPLTGETTAVWTFRPFEAGLRTADVAVIADNVQVGQLLAEGTATARTVIDINEAGFKAEMERVIRALNGTPGADGIPGTVDDVISYIRADGFHKTASNRFKTEFAGFLPTERQPGPDGVLGTADDTFAGGDLAMRIDTEFIRLRDAVMEDYNAVNGTSVAYTFGTVSPDVTMVWKDHNQPGVGGQAESDTLPFSQTFEIRNGEISEAAKEWLLAEGLNKEVKNTGEFAVSNAIEWTSDITFGAKLSAVVSHEVAHTFGLNDAYLKVPGGAGAVNTDPQPDIMNASFFGDGDRGFTTNNVTLLQAALGFHPNGDLPLKDALRMFRNNFNLPFSGQGIQDEIDPNFLPPELALFSDEGLILPGEGVAIGENVAVDGAGGALVTRDLILTNAGLAPVNLSSTALDIGSAFSLVNDLAGTVLDPGETAILTVRFDPQSAGSFQDTLTVTSNANTSPVLSIQLDASAIPLEPTAELTLGHNNFGGLEVEGGAGQLPQIATVRNGGSQPLEISGIRLAEGLGPFSLLGVPSDLLANPVTLDTGESFTFGLAFDPNQLGLTRGVFEVVTNDPGAPTVTGTAVGTGLGPVVYPDWGNDFVAFETPELDASVDLHTRSDNAGNFELFLPPDAFYHLAIFDPITGLISHGFGQTPQSGTGLDLTARLVFAASTAPDSDGDGLPDDIEFAVGTSVNKVDTDGDGLRDFVEIQQGLDPLGGLGLPVGVISTLPLVGETHEVVVTGSLLDAGVQTAYVATGTNGLAIVNTSALTMPVLLSQLDLPGDAVDVGIDTRLNIAAVAAGTGGLHLVDVSNPMAPALLQTIEGDAAQVEVFDGVAYVASGVAVKSIDLSSGETIQTLGFGGFDLSGLAREGGFLYTMESINRTLRVIEIDDGTMAAHGMVTMPKGGASIFVGNGIAFAAAEGDDFGGFTTADVSNPDAPVVLSGVDVNSIAGRDFAGNSSGLGVLVGQPGGVSALDVVDVENPDDTGAFRSRVPLPGVPEAVSIAGGIAYVAGGASGLHVVNYIGFDGRGTAPAISIESPLGDLDPATPGVQILEGSSIPIRAQATDDVQVRNVELLVNGELVANALSFPFDLHAVGLSDTGTSVVVQARATDSGGNVALSNPLTFDLVPDTFAPMVTSTSPADGASGGPGVRLVTVRFDEPLDPATVSAEDFMLRDASNQLFAPQTFQLRNDDRTVALTFAPLTAGAYTLTVGTDLADRAGNLLAGPVTSHFDLVQTSITFIGAVNDQWGEPGNWSTGAVPEASDTVFIPEGASVTFLPFRATLDETVTSIIGGGSLTILRGEIALTGSGEIGHLTLDRPFGDDSILRVPDTFTITSSFDWIGGTLTGAGTTVVPAGSTLALTGSGVREINGHTFDLAGAGTWSGTGMLVLRNSGVFQNEGSFTDLGNNSIGQIFNTGTNVFENAGAFIKSGGVGTTTVTVPLVNSGTVDAESGTLSINGNGSSTGLITTNIGATTRFDGGASAATFNLETGTIISGSGSVLLSSGTLNVAGDISAPVFALAGSATLSGAATLTVTESLTWSGGTMSGPGATDVAAGATFAITTAGVPKTLNSRTINNTGDATMTGSVSISFSNGATFNNIGSFTAGDSEAFINGGGAASVFNNSGEFTKTGGAGQFNVNIPFTNTGTVTIESGTLNLPGGFTNSAVFDLRKLATVIVNGAFTNTAAGVIQLDLGGTAPADYPSFMVSGAATLDGILNVFFVDGFIPNVADAFQVLTYNSHTGTFATITDDDPAHTVDPTYNATNLLLTVA